MQEPREVLSLLTKYREVLNNEIKKILEKQEAYTMYDMMSYFMGFKDEQFNPIDVFGGKRFRSAMTLLIANYYGDYTKAIPAALSIELFHNFTLIHDDIVDGDEKRRNRPTVWKLWGIDHAINTGDGQSILTFLAIVNNSTLPDKSKVTLLSFLGERYLEVIEGQHLDFFMTEEKLGDPFIDYKLYIEMIGKKTATLIAAATTVAGISLGLVKKERTLLYEFGYNLGMAYQLCDDLYSIWGYPEATGKIPYNDIRAKKKTYPILYAYEKLNQKEQEEFKEIYNTKDTLGETSIQKVISFLEDVDAKSASQEIMKTYISNFDVAISNLSIEDEKKEVLSNLSNKLIPLIS